MTNSAAVVLSWVLVHFLWQGAALALIGACVERCLAPRNSSGRYASWLAVLALMAATPVVTGWWLWQSDSADTIVETHAIPAFETTPFTEPVGHSAASLSVAEFTGAEPGDPNQFVVSSSSETPSTWISWLQTQWHGWIVSLWASGVMLGLVRLMGGVAYLGWLVRTAEPVPDAWRTTAARLSQRFGLRAVPRLVLSRWVGEPLAMQWFRPFIVLPASWACQFPPEMIEAVLAHELAHLRRYDLWVNLLQRTVETVLFFHPAVWWVSRKIRREREVCCDVWAVAVTGRAVAYAKTLEAVARCRLAWSNPALAAGMGGERMALFNRVRRVLGEPAGRESGWWPLGLAGAGLAASCWAGVALSTSNAQGEDEAGPVSAVLAQADGDKKEEDRPRPPRPEGREGDRPPPRGEGREGDRPGPPPPRGEGDRPRPPREGERPPEGRGPRPEGDRGPEGRPGPRPEGDRGPEGRPGPRDGEGRGPRPEGDRGPEGRPGPRPDGERGPGPGFGPGPGNGPPEFIRELMMSIGELRREVQILREEVRELRGQRGGPGFVPPGAREGGPRPPRDGERPPEGRGPRPEGGPREGGPRPDGPPREGDRPRPPREGEGPRPEGREGDRPRPDTPRPERRDGEDAPRPERRPDA